MIRDTGFSVRLFAEGNDSRWRGFPGGDQGGLNTQA